MKLYIEKDYISGDIDYFNDNCSGTLSGKLLSDTKLELSETITKGSDICANGKHLFTLKNNIIYKANYYYLEGSKNTVIINKYSFTPKPNIWENIALKLKIERKNNDIKLLEDSLSEPKRLLEEAQEDKRQAQYLLDNNHTEVYKGGQCIELPLAEPKPEPFFDTQEKARNYALAYCSVSFGCRIGIELARDKLDTAAKRFLASQSCSLMVKNYIREGTLLDETMFNLLDAVSYEGCEEEGDGIFSGLIQGGSCIMSGATRLARVGQYINCIDYKTKEFHNTYLDWKNEPIKKKTACEKDLKVVKETPKIVAKYNDELHKIRDKITVKNKELEQLKRELKKVLLLRKKQSELIKELTK